MLEELVQHLFGLGAAPQFHNNRNAVAVGGVAQIGNGFDDPFGGQFGDALDEGGFVDLVGDFGDVDALPSGTAGDFFDFGRSTHNRPPFARGIGVANALCADDETARGEIGRFDELHQVVHCHIVHAVVMVNQVDDGLAQFAQIVGRNIGGHTDGDASGAVEQ